MYPGQNEIKKVEKQGRNVRKKKQKKLWNTNYGIKNFIARKSFKFKSSNGPHSYAFYLMTEFDGDKHFIILVCSIIFKRGKIIKKL